LEVMAGPDAIDGAGWKLRLPPPAHKKLRSYKVAVMLNDRNAEVDQQVQDQLQSLADWLGRRKVKVDDAARPDIATDDMARLYIKLLRAATSGRTSDQDFQRNQELAKSLRSNDDSFYARAVRANVLSHREWLQANEVRHQM